MITILLFTTTLASSVFATETAVPTPIPEAESSSEVVYSTVATLSPPNPEKNTTAGLIIWISIAIATGIICIYMVLNITRLYQEEKIRQENELLKPKLIIATKYTRTINNYMDDQ